MANYRIDYNTPQGRQWFRDNLNPGFVAYGVGCPVDATLEKQKAFWGLIRDLPPAYRVESNPGQWPGQAPENGFLAVFPHGTSPGVEMAHAAQVYCQRHEEECFLKVTCHTAGGPPYYACYLVYANGCAQLVFTFEHKEG